MNNATLEKKVLSICSKILAEQRYVSAVDLLIDLGYLQPSVLNDWRRGRLDFLEKGMQVNLAKLSFAMGVFRKWAIKCGLSPRETAYMQHATSAKIHLRFSKSGDAQIEKHYRTHYISPLLTQEKQEKFIGKVEESPEPVVHIISKEAQCSKWASRRMTLNGALANISGIVLCKQRNFLSWLASEGIQKPNFGPKCRGSCRRMAFLRLSTHLS